MLGGLLLAGALLAAAMANGTIVQALDGGTRSASIAGASLGALSYSHTSQVSTGSVTLTVDDSTGSDLGWNVTVQSSALAYTGSFSGVPLAASNLLIGMPGAPAVVTGQAIDGANGPLAASGGTLDTPRKVIYANAGYGKGQYTQSLPVELTVPGMTIAGTYTATLIVDITAGP
ncbi:MAG TPA: hypothetical protein VMM78_05370 [Thermomicrobiales bacterium]|nr:hypothetical protein [Thermomicrobiales bacterium]